MNKKQTLGEVVRLHRKRLKWSGQDLVDKVREKGVEISNPHLSSIEHGVRSPSEELAKALASVLGQDQDYFVMLAGAVPKRIVNKGFRSVAARKAVKELERG